MEKLLTVITYKEPEELTTRRGDENRLVHLSKDDRISMQSIDNFKKDKVKGEVVLDVTGLTILQYFKICRKLGFFIKNVHFQDSFEKWNRSLLRFFITKDFTIRKIFFHTWQWIYYVINEIFFSFSLKKAGFISKNESVICSLSPIKVGLISNGVTKGLKREFQNLPADQKPEFFFFGNALYEPNFVSLKYFLKHYWTESFRDEFGKLAIHGWGSEELSSFLEKELCDKISTEGEFDELETLLKPNRIYLNPVECGAGIKTRTQEAMLKGIPMLCHSHALEGLPEMKDYPFRYHDKTSFEVALREITTNFEKHIPYLKNVQEIVIKKYDWFKTISEYIDFFSE